MPAPFQDLDPTAAPPDFVQLLGRFPFERRLTGVHLHHTARLRHADWRAHGTLQTQWFSDTRQLGWSDIAQHLTIAPDGVIWTGRDWNRPPCSAPGQNGDRVAGPFMIVLAGDFNPGNDRLDGEQRRQLIDTVARLQERFALAGETLGFHGDLDGGDAVDRAALLDAVAARRTELAAARTDGAPAARPGTPPFGEDVEAWYQFITICNQNRGHLRDEPADVPRAVERAPGIVLAADGRAP